ncbi:MAG: hypothetical protein WAN53_02345 [Candidatus Bathyarchaeia archaeon]
MTLEIPSVCTGTHERPDKTSCTQITLNQAASIKIPMSDKAGVA